MLKCASNCAVLYLGTHLLYNIRLINYWQLSILLTEPVSILILCLSFVVMMECLGLAGWSTSSLLKVSVKYWKVTPRLPLPFVLLFIQFPHIVLSLQQSFLQRQHLGLSVPHLICLWNIFIWGNLLLCYTRLISPTERDGNWLNCFSTFFASANSFCTFSTFASASIL